MRNKRSKNELRPQQRYQKKYRQHQSHKGLARFELQVSAESKVIFEDMVKAAAEEYIEPHGERQRMAKARIRIFDEITKDIKHEFFTLKDQIKALKDEITALSPSFFKSDETQSIPLPEAIRALPDDPKRLKALLARTYKEAQQARLAAREYKRKAEQYESLYEAASSYNDKLTLQLKEAGAFIEE